MIVEDDVLVADGVRAALNRAGYETEHAGSAEAALPRLETSGFALAVVDIGLPGQSGLELVSRLRRRGLRLPIMVLTARDRAEDRATAFATGADDFMAKPFKVAELVARCEALAQVPDMHASSKAAIAPASPLEDASELSACERDILDVLIRNRGKIVTSAALAQQLSQTQLDRAQIEEHLESLRTKLGSRATLRAVRGLGYILT